MDHSFFFSFIYVRIYGLDALKIIKIIELCLTLTDLKIDVDKKKKKLLIINLFITLISCKIYKKPIKEIRDKFKSIMLLLN